ncbi:MAG: response regulator [Fuerstiella sp.]
MHGAKTSNPDLANATNEQLRAELTKVAQAASETADAILSEAACALLDLLSVTLLLSEDNSGDARVAEIAEFCRQAGLQVLSGGDSSDSLVAVVDEVGKRWGAELDLLAPEERFACQSSGQWPDSSSGGWDVLLLQQPQEDNASDVLNKPAATFALDIDGILASLAECERQESAAAPAAENIHAQVVDEVSLPQPPSSPEVIDDPEMAAAFADDAQQCLGEMESSLLSLDTGSDSAAALLNFCRQLHTLKGASGTVGLSQLAKYLHDVESYLDATANSKVDVDALLKCLDTIRFQLDAIGVSGHGAVVCSTSFNCQPPGSAYNVDTVSSLVPSVVGKVPAAVSPPVSPAASVGAESELFVRVEASRLERLMDLLAELVMLRNRRDTYVESLHTIHHELNQSASRTRALTSCVEFNHSATGDVGHQSSADATGANAKSLFLSRSLDEISKDVSEIGRSVQGLFDPLSEDNSAVSHLIGRFRQELMELRRLPVGGLFQRLQRSIRDAARAEGKQVEVRFEGQGARAERAVQDRLFEPLLHLVRNAVSHGMETAEVRVASGKPACGCVVLAAWSDAASLCIEVRDDGPGLNDVALETRGRELGLLQPGEVVSQSRLWKLIFHPGFSTKSAASEISGRGVGMDVVDNWVRRLRGRIDVESNPGNGTTFRLHIPLRSAIEHAMVVRSGGQLFAVPMHAVSGTSDSRLPMSDGCDSAGSKSAVPLSEILGCRTEQLGRGCHITLRDNGKKNDRDKARSRQGTTISVDAIVGVEEVVVRALPSLLQRNELFAGVTLSGRAETVLLLDVCRLLEVKRRGTFSACEDVTEPAVTPAASELQHSKSCVLVVDDSVVIRRSLTRRLKAIGFDVSEACNGKEALAILRSGGIAAVVSDIDMPGMNGLDLLHEMKRQKSLQDIPVTILTSRDEDRTVAAIRSLQPDALLNKPVTDVTVTAIVDSFSGGTCRIQSVEPDIR